jgi:hypothetical protein
MPEIYRFIINYEYQEQKVEIYYLKYIVFEIYTKMVLSVNTNSEAVSAKTQC